MADGPREADARWEPVRVEFEYRSRNFFYHGHDAAGCEVIVCWQHDWPDCPIEVLELRRVVAAAARKITAIALPGDAELDPEGAFGPLCARQVPAPVPGRKGP